MTLIPADIEEKLGFDKIRELLIEQCSSDHARELAASISFITSPETLMPELHLANEMYKTLQSGGSPPLNYTFDIRVHLKYIRAYGTFLQPDDFLNISRALHSAESLVRFFRERGEDCPGLWALVDNISVDPVLKEEINRIISEDGQVRDSASRELQQLRNSLASARNRLRKSLDKVFRQAVKDGYVPEKTSITVRDGRMVIPVLAEYKRRIRGFIHDESSTGQTVYLEPAEVLESNNEIRELELAERREIIRILTRLTDLLREELPSLSQSFDILAKLDLIRSKSRLARDIEACMPEFSDKPVSTLVNARHPLLFLNYRGSARKVVPLSLSINSEQRIMVISGPNAGGKSVCLKTVGLIQYMWQCGLLVPVAEDSVMGLYKDILLDIGDEQSIDNDLSTYSSHLTLMKMFLETAGKNSLVLIDEFGTGTDPQFGGAVAEAILTELITRRCRGIITTHYGNIKSFAENHPNVLNGAMKYDVERLTPLYQLQAGVPGSSFTFEVARKIGLPEAVIEYARNAVGADQTSVEELLLELEKQKQGIRERDRELASREKQTKSVLAKYEQLLADLEENKKLIMSRAKEEASDLLQKTNREIEKTIRHIKENKAERKETRKVRQRLTHLKDEVKPASDLPVKKHQEQGIRVGDSVRISGSEVTGEVLALRGKDAEIRIGALKTTTRKSKLELISRGEAKRVQKAKTVRSNVDLSQKLATFSQTLDVRGKRGNEVLGLVDKFVDDGIIFNASELRILHGKGDGILRTLIRNHLKGNSSVEHMADAHIEHGGAGITVVTLR